MKTTEEYFQEFYNEMRYQLEQGVKANFARANKIWAKYEASQSAQSDELSTLRAQLAEANGIIQRLCLSIAYNKTSSKALIESQTAANEYLDSVKSA